LVGYGTPRRSGVEGIATACSPLAQFRIDRVAQRVAEQAETEDCQRDRQTRKDRDPWRRPFPVEWNAQPLALGSFVDRSPPAAHCSA
jgi:hypothetical protein